MKRDPRAEVRRRYAQAAKGGCCGGADAARSGQVGYSRQELGSIPSEANLGLGCGNPTAIGELKAGDKLPSEAQPGTMLDVSRGVRGRLPEDLYPPLKP